jgi:hypothetical protein
MNVSVVCGGDTRPTTTTATRGTSATASSSIVRRVDKRERHIAKSANERSPDGCFVVECGKDDEDDKDTVSAGAREPRVRGFGSKRRTFTLAAACAALSGASNALARAGEVTTSEIDRQAFTQTFPTLFKPFIGRGTKKTVKRELVPGQLWALEQNIELGPLETTIRCVVVRLRDGSLWVHAPLAPTEEFFEMVEACGDRGRSQVKYVVVPTYALEHKIFTKDALRRWTDAELYAAPGQFTFPIRDVSDAIVFGRRVNYVLNGNDKDANAAVVPWKDEIEFETLQAGTFDVGSTPQTIYETAFFHKESKTLIVTDAVAQIPLNPPEANSVDKLLVVSQRSTADPIPEDTPAARQIGWEKTALLVNFFFPEHEELDPSNPGVVIWTDGWHDNFQALAGRLLVPPVVRTLLYAQNPPAVRRWVDAVVSRWDFERVVPAHWEAPVATSPEEFARAFRFLEDDTLDRFPEGDLARGLAPIARAVVKP